MNSKMIKELSRIVNNIKYKMLKHSNNRKLEDMKTEKGKVKEVFLRYLRLSKIFLVGESYTIIIRNNFEGELIDNIDLLNVIASIEDFRNNKIISEIQNRIIFEEIQPKDYGSTISKVIDEIQNIYSLPKQHPRVIIPDENICELMNFILEIKKIKDEVYNDYKEIKQESKVICFIDIDNKIYPYIELSVPDLIPVVSIYKYELCNKTLRFLELDEYAIDSEIFKKLVILDDNILQVKAKDFRVISRRKCDLTGFERNSKMQDQVLKMLGISEQNRRIFI